MAKPRTLFLYYDPHYFHEALAKSIGAKPRPAPAIRSSEKKLLSVLHGGATSLGAVISLPKDYDVYFCEGTYLFPAMAKRLGLLNKEAKIINIVSSPLFYYMKTGRVSGSRLSLAISLLREVDGFVCVGKMEESLLKSFYPSANTMVTYPFIRKDVMKRILKQPRPKLESKKILFVGNRDTYYKGLDLLVEAFRKARERIPELELTIIGDYDRDAVGPDRAGIHCPGYVKYTAKYIREASLYVHLGRGEAFGVSVMEAMLGGLPALVSNATGSKELVAKVDQRMIVPLDSKKAADKIISYFGLSQRQRSRMAERGIKAVKKYKEEAILSEFKKGYAKLLLHE